MQYTGKLYGKIGTRYFDTGKTAADWDAMEMRVKELENVTKQTVKRSNIVKNQPFPSLLHECIINDDYIKELNLKKAEIYDKSPSRIIIKNGSARRVYPDSVLDTVSKINELIEHRKQQIIQIHTKP